MTKNQKIIAGVSAVALVLAVALGAKLFSGKEGDGGSGLFEENIENMTLEEMRLEYFQGDISLLNSGMEKHPVEGSRLVSQDNLTTYWNSSAFILLDSVKMLRMLEISQLEVTQNSKNYKVELLEGSVFFCVTEALEDHESLFFQTNNAITGVRGTSGLVTYNTHDDAIQIAVFSGTVVCTIDGVDRSISVGECGIITTAPNGTVTFAVISLVDEPPLYYFSDQFIEEIQGDLTTEVGSIPFSEYLRDDRAYHENLYEDSLRQYQEYLYYSQVSKEWDLVPYFHEKYESLDELLFGYQFYDIDGDGGKELLIYEGYGDVTDLDVDVVLEGVCHIFTMDKNGKPVDVYFGETVDVYEGNQVVKPDGSIHALVGQQLQPVEGTTLETAISPDWALLSPVAPESQEDEGVEDSDHASDESVTDGTGSTGSTASGSTGTGSTGSTGTGSTGSTGTGSTGSTGTGSTGSTGTGSTGTGDTGTGSTGTGDTGTGDTGTGDTGTGDTGTDDTGDMEGAGSESGTDEEDTGSGSQSSAEKVEAVAVSMVENILSSRTFGASGYEVPESSNIVYVSLSNLTMFSEESQEQLFQSIENGLPRGKTAVRTTRESLLSNGFTFVNGNGIEGENESYLKGAYFTEIVVTSYGNEEITLTIGGVTYEGTLYPDRDDYELTVVSVVYPN